MVEVIGAVVPEVCVGTVFDVLPATVWPWLFMMDYLDFLLEEIS